MPIAIDPTKVIEYILLCDRELPPEDQTVYELKVLTARELARIEDGAARADVAGNIEFRGGTQTLNILTMGLKGWRNFKDGQGRDIPFRENNGVPRPENWDYLTPEWRRELANAVTEQTRVTEIERKN